MGKVYVLKSVPLIRLPTLKKISIYMTSTVIRTTKSVELPILIEMASMFHL